MIRKGLYCKVLIAATVAAAALGIGVSATPAEATTIGITAAFTDVGGVDLGSYGAEFSFVPNGTVRGVPGIPGTTLAVSETTGFSALRLSQDAGSFPGNFGTGETLLYTFGGGPLDFVFNNPIARFGQQIEAGDYGTFVARIEAFNALNQSLGFFTRAGVGTSAGDDSAIFIGIGSTAREISRVRLSLLSAPASGSTADFAVNSPSISLTAIPEPTTMTLLGSGLAGVILRRRRRARRSPTPSSPVSTRGVC